MAELLKRTHMCGTLNATHVDKEVVLMLGVYPLVYAVIKLMLIVFFFVSLDMLVPEGIKIKKNEAEESAE